MDFDRRNFFGVIAAPLLRRFTPPVPVAKGPGLGMRNGTMSFATLAKVRSISGPSRQFDPDFWNKKITTLLDAGSVSFDMKFEK